jgi:dTDP-4-dehydrorhamnose 3,5-epimerase
MTVVQGKKDHQVVTAEGQSVAPRIEGVVIRPVNTFVDDRGWVCEGFNINWGLLDLDKAPIVYIEQVMIRPGKIKGWFEHHLKDDRLLHCMGTMRWVLYDNRPESPTYRMINEIYLSDYNRQFLVIPTRVFHAVQNVGTTDAMFVNFPTQPYDHANPDKFRLPIENDVIPFSFETNKLGW